MPKETFKEIFNRIANKKTEDESEEDGEGSESSNTMSIGFSNLQKESNSDKKEPAVENYFENLAKRNTEIERQSNENLDAANNLNNLDHSNSNNHNSNESEKDDGYER